MKTARAVVIFLAAGCLIAASRSLSQTPKPAQEFASGMTDIGPDAYTLLSDAFSKDADKWFGDAETMLTVEQAGASDPKLWLDLATEFSTKLDTAIDDAKPKAKEYLGPKWSKDWPGDWKGLFSKARKFVLYMAESGYKSYAEWAKYAAWTSGYATDASNAEKKIAAIGKDFKKLNDRIGECSSAFVDEKPEKKIKEILDDVKKMRDNAIAADLIVLGENRQKLKEIADAAERKPDAVKAALQKYVENFKLTVAESAAMFPSAKGFSEDLVAQADKLVAAYEKSHKALMAAAEPILGDKPPIWQKLVQFEGWSYADFPAKLDALIKKLDMEFARKFGVQPVD